MARGVDPLINVVVLKLSLIVNVFFSASQIWELAEGKSNTMELAEAIDSSDLEAFGFTDDFIFELWGAITGQAARNITSLAT